MKKIIRNKHNPYEYNPEKPDTHEEFELKQTDHDEEIILAGVSPGWEQICNETQFKREKPRCPEVIRKQAGDESYDICGLNTKACLIEHGLNECDTYNEFLKEEDNE